ncbi:DUF3826 domain-containing protein [Pelagicoccus albus]|uniref:DUF3826 domain-containing protein n=1 Tax=Pelagicoccus albus TaxID=415222 RepID=A0A7X1E8X1_9BACT|nr:DUF3826 domain-containing protein [Pelagicoccus albus]MBC2605227.1 DUF3826 domain-containing protein [Pelagicoccus albus]
MKKRSLVAFLCLGALVSLEARASSDSSEEAAYWQTVMKRGDKIVAKMDLKDRGVEDRVSEIIAAQYRDLRDIHDGRDAKVAELKESGAAAEEIETLKREADLDVYELHYAFLAKLSTELNEEQVEQVKDGMTYGVVPNTYYRYMQLLGDLDDVHKRYIYAALVEAREHAMDEGSSDEKHKRFGKYKGRINNYLSKLGVNMKERERILAEKEKAARAE